jgi:exonuclease III
MSTTTSTSTPEQQQQHHHYHRRYLFLFIFTLVTSRHLIPQDSISYHPSGPFTFCALSAPCERHSHRMRYFLDDHTDSDSDSSASTIYHDAHDGTDTSYASDDTDIAPRYPLPPTPADPPSSTIASCDPPAALPTSSHTASCDPPATNRYNRPTDAPSSTTLTAAQNAEVQQHMQALFPSRQTCSTSPLSLPPLPREPPRCPSPMQATSHVAPRNRPYDPPPSKHQIRPPSPPPPPPSTTWFSSIRHPFTTNRQILPIDFDTNAPGNLPGTPSPSDTKQHWKPALFQRLATRRLATNNNSTAPYRPLPLAPAAATIDTTSHQLNPAAKSFVPLVVPTTSPTNDQPTLKTDRKKKTNLPTHGTPNIKLATYNIRDGRNSRIQLLARNLTCQNIDICIATEIKIPQGPNGSQGVHSRHDQGYDIFCTYTTTKNQGGVALFSKADSKHWHIEAAQRHGPNVLSCLLVSGSKSTPLIGVYLPPNSLDDLPYLTAALARFHNLKTSPIVLGDLNTDLSDLTNSRATAIGAVLSNNDLHDMLPMFRQRPTFKGLFTWRQRQLGKTYRTRCDYILGSDRRLFKTVSIKDPRHFTSDHYMLVASLRAAPPREHKAYLQGRKRFPLTPNKTPAA